MAKLLLVVEAPGDTLAPEQVALHLNLGAGIDLHAPSYEVRRPTPEEVGELVNKVALWSETYGPGRPKDGTVVNSAESASDRSDQGAP